MSKPMRIVILPFMLGAILIGTLANIGLTTYETHIIKQYLGTPPVEGP